ncbi:MAG: acyltransferase [Gammaproteobacteria bacterium]|nr:acyltransferase [Gammaproteobacteria bacterium]
MARVPIWDGWRGLAISLLLIGHFFPIGIFDWARMGVDFFFVLSGMLMSKILFEKRMKLTDFYVRRFSRIFPALIMYVAVAYAVATLASWPYSPGEIVANLVFIRTYWPADPHIWDAIVPIGHLWSLNVEEHAYVLMSIMTILYQRNRNAATTLIVLGLLSIAIAFYQSSGDNLHPRSLIRTECAISFVFLSAGYNLVKNRYNIRPPKILPVLTVILAMLCYLKVVPLAASFSLAPILLAFTVNHLVDSAGPMQAVLDFKPLRMMGLWSYSIYLWQQPFYMFSYTLPAPAITGVILAIIIGYLSFSFYENPTRSWINRRWTRKYEVVS